MTTLATDLTTRAQTLGQTLLANQSPLYQNGVFYQFDMTNYHRMGFPHAALMASLCNTPGLSAGLRASYLRIIGEVIEFSLATNMNTNKDYWVDGGIDPYGLYGQYPDHQAMFLNYIPGATTTIEQSHDLAWILWELPESSFPSGSWQRWRSVCQAAVTQLDARPGNSITTYYINGNYQAQLLGCYWYTALISPAGPTRDYYIDCYERAYNFMVKPALVSGTYTGWGLTEDVHGTQPDWADAQVHLTETNTRVVGGANWDLDWGYSMVQADALARVFLANRDTRLIRIINGITNKLDARWNRATHVLDASSGSRVNQANTGYTNCYFEIQALLGVKGLSTLDLTQAECLLRWTDLAANISGNSSNGFYGHQAALSRTIAPILAAARVPTNATIPAS